MRSEQDAAVDVFFSYSHRDEKLRDELELHLALLKRQGTICMWHDRRVGAGREWEGEIDGHLEAADLILLLISPDFIASDYCYDREMRRAIARHEGGGARVIPIILRPCDWQSAPFGKLQALPTDVQPITRWDDRDEAFLDVARGIRTAITELRRARLTNSPVGGPAVNVPTLLPYRCDRSLQNDRLVVIPELREERPGRPTVVLLSGHHREALDKYVDLLRAEQLPQILDIDRDHQPFLRKGPWTLTDSVRGTAEKRCTILWSKLARKIYGKSIASLDDVAATLADERCPLVIDMIFPVIDGGPPPDPQLIEAWLDRLAEWPATHDPLIFVLRFSWGDNAEHRPLFRKCVRARVQDLIEATVRKWRDDERLAVVDLPTLESVSEGEAIMW